MLSSSFATGGSRQRKKRCQGLALRVIDRQRPGLYADSTLGVWNHRFILAKPAAGPQPPSSGDGVQQPNTWPQSAAPSSNREYKSFTVLLRPRPPVQQQQQQQLGSHPPRQLFATAAADDEEEDDAVFESEQKKSDPETTLRHRVVQANAMRQRRRTSERDAKTRHDEEGARNSDEEVEKEKTRKRNSNKKTRATVFDVSPKEFDALSEPEKKIGLVERVTRTAATELSKMKHLYLPDSTSGAGGGSGIGLIGPHLSVLSAGIVTAAAATTGILVWGLLKLSRVRRK